MRTVSEWARPWRSAFLAGLLVVAGACSSGPNIIDPYHAPNAGHGVPDTIVELDLENRYDFDIIPTRINGERVAFNRDHADNQQEPLRIPPGVVRFVVTNPGVISHNFRLEGTTPAGQPLDLIIPAREVYLGENDMWEMELRLWEGEFEISCAVTNHDRRGMWRPMTVTSEVSYPPATLAQ
ncbi:MAG: hypothetical protein QGI09_07180 [Dehalococcoidia bacterium]|nr:hypothetical protein [Dehalococcoidia bacterium]